MNAISPLHDSGVQYFVAARKKAIENVSNQFITSHPEIYDAFGPKAVTACKEDIGYTLDFFRPVLEFGIVQPFIDYLHWISEVLSSRGIDENHVLQMIDWLAGFFIIEIPGDIGELISDRLTMCKSTLLSQTAELPKIEQLMPEPWPEYMDLKAALLSGDAITGKEILATKIRNGCSLIETEVHLIQPALYQVGREWQQNTITVMQEHLATATAMAIIAQCRAFASIRPSNGKSVICACVEGNHHAVGAQIVADAFETQGWKTSFLGSNVAADEILKNVKLIQPNLVCLSLSMPEHLATAKEIISRIRVELGENLPAIMLGGLAINAFNSLAKLVGADSTAPHALAAIESYNQ